MRYRIEASRAGEALDREVFLGEAGRSYANEAAAQAALDELEASRPDGHEDVTYRVVRSEATS